MSEKLESTQELVLPDLYESAEQASATAQLKFVRLSIASLALLVITAGVASVTLEDTEIQEIVAIVTAVLVGVATLVSIAIKFWHFQDSWYGGRAIAESTKTVAWKYTVRAAPFNGELSDANKLLSANLREILRSQRRLNVNLDAVSANTQLTSEMSTLRAAPLNKRIDAYKSGRVASQKEWYSAKAATHKTRSRQFFGALILSELTALVIAILYVAYSPGQINLVGVVAAIAIATTSWLQTRDHETLSIVYSFTSHELGIVELKLQTISSEDEFSEFVNEAESAISREHTMWVARRSSELGGTSS